MSWLPLRNRQAAGLLPSPYRPDHPRGMRRDRKALTDFSSDLWRATWPVCFVRMWCRMRPGTINPPVNPSNQRQIGAVKRYTVPPEILHTLNMSSRSLKVSNDVLFFKAKLNKLKQLPTKLRGYFSSPDPIHTPKILGAPL